jgi:hypothetical protein
MSQSLVFHHVALCMSMVSGTPGYISKLKVRGPTVELIMIHQDQWLGGIGRTQVARELILQGSPAIQTAVSLRGYVSTSEELWDERWVTQNHHCIPPQLENVK